MEKKLEAIPIPTDEFAASRPGYRTAALGLAVAIALVVFYYWPIIRVYLDL